MNHFWHTIPGYFTFPAYYQWVANQARAPWHGVEVGVYTGQSAAYLSVALNGGEYTNLIQLDLVDLELTKHGALKNLAPITSTGIIGVVHELDSVEASKLYADESLDFVFIDADHSYEAVKRDIAAWLPKVKSGGIIAGHDYCVWPGFGVIEAVTEAFERVDVWRGSKGMGDAQMQPRYWPVWSVRV
jgi:predicted O-methyltransferase YrrM